MEKVVMMRSLYRSICRRSLGFSSAAVVTTAAVNRHLLSGGTRHFHHISPNCHPSDCRPPFAMGIGGTRCFSQGMSHLPLIKDFEIESVFKDLMAASWDEIPDAVVYDAKKALSKNTDDKAGQETLANVFHAAEAVEEFSGILVSLRMEIDDSVGMSGENVKELPEEFTKALVLIHQRYIAYLDSFGPDEVYLRKKVETELGTKMIHLKMRCSGLDADWGKITVLGTSGLSGSYVEHRA